MPEQSVHPREDADADQQNRSIIPISKGEVYENHRQRCTGRIQRRY